MLRKLKYKQLDINVNINIKYKNTKIYFSVMKVSSKSLILCKLQKKSKVRAPNLFVPL